MEAALRAIAEPHRREILRLVRDQELTAGEIAAQFEVSRPAVSQHLTVLKEAGLVVERRLGTHRLYRARPEGLAELRSYLDEFWGDRLEQLKAAVERTEGERAEGDPTEMEATRDAHPRDAVRRARDPHRGPSGSDLRVLHRSREDAPVEGDVGPA